MKGYGLTKNSPIKLSLSRENYEALIARHGQWIRWLRASKCTCVSANGRPDLNCTKCGGEGYLYGFQERATETVMLSYLDGGVVELPYEDATVVGVHDYMGLSYTPTARFGKFCKISGDRTPDIGEQVQVILDRPIAKTVLETPLTYLGAGCFEAKELRVSGKEGIASERSTQDDIISVASIYNITKNISYTPTGYRRNFIFADNVVDITVGDMVVAQQVVYLEPFLFAITGQQHSEPDWKFLEVVGGDASMTFPSWAGVGEGDIVTILADSQVGKVVIEKQVSGIDIIPAFYIDSIEYIESGSEKYFPSEHFDLWGVNKIKWRSVLELPADNSPLFVMFRYFPTYRVIREFPNVRSSENQHLPRRVALKLLSTYGERKGI